jgi:sigma-B regulation protein RsbU (phosphoserine phosphatase)
MPLTDLVTFATAVVILTAGLGAIAGYVIRSNRRERLLLWFGLFGAIYGVRMFFKQPLVAALEIPRTSAAWGESTLNYLILIPAFLFAQELYGPGWRGTFRWILAGISVYAVVAIVGNVMTGNPYAVPDPSNAFLAAVAIAILSGVRGGYKPPPFPEWRVLVAGIVVFLLFVVNSHAVGASLVPWRFNAEPLGFLVQLACLGYIAVSRFFSQDRRLAAIDQEMRSAREIQMSILPSHLPEVSGVRVAARYLPLAAVAGDLYDAVALDDGGLALLVADVSGHGVPAALIASMVKVAFTSSLVDSQDPGTVLTRMNTTLCGMFARSYVTAACVVARPAQHSIEYALAGHPPPLMLERGNGAVAALNERGIILGFLPSATYTTTSVSFATDVRLVIYTDGVIEAPGADDDQFGIERLALLTASRPEGPPASFIDAVMDAIRRFSRSKDASDNGAAMAHDDVTLVVADVSSAPRGHHDDDSNACRGSDAQSCARKKAPADARVLESGSSRLGPEADGAEVTVLARSPGDPLIPTARAGGEVPSVFRFDRSTRGSRIHTESRPTSSATTRAATRTRRGSP